MQDVMFKCWAKAQIAKQQAKQNIKNFFSEEKGGADTLIIAVVIIVIVIAAGIIFRDELGGWLETLFGKAENQINEV